MYSSFLHNFWYFYNDCVVVKNNYAELNEIQSVVLEKSKKGKENLYELKLTTKFDLLICTVVSDDAKSLLRQLNLIYQKT